MIYIFIAYNINIHYLEELCPIHLTGNRNNAIYCNTNGERWTSDVWHKCRPVFPTASINPNPFVSTLILAYAVSGPYHLHAEPAISPTRINRSPAPIITSPVFPSTCINGALTQPRVTTSGGGSPSTKNTPFAGRMRRNPTNSCTSAVGRAADDSGFISLKFSTSNFRVTSLTSFLHRLIKSIASCSRQVQPTRRLAISCGVGQGLGRLNLEWSAKSANLPGINASASPNSA